MPGNSIEDPKFQTIPRYAKSRGFSPKIVRRMIRELGIPLYCAGNAWPRVDAAEADAAIHRTRIPSTNHALARVEEVLDRERQAAEP